MIFITVFYCSIEYHCWEIFGGCVNKVEEKKAHVANLSRWNTKEMNDFRRPF